MAHFRETLPLSLGPDISKETTSQPPSSVKSSYPCTHSEQEQESGVYLIWFFSLFLLSREQTGSRACWWQGRWNYRPKHAEFMISYLYAGSSLFVCVFGQINNESKLNFLKHTKLADNSDGTLVKVVLSELSNLCTTQNSIFKGLVCRL